MLRIQRYDSCETLGKALADVLGDRKTSLLIASSDLSHFYTEAEAHVLDSTMLDRVAAFDPEGVIRVEEQGKAFACGRAAIATVLVAARALGANCAQIVGYGTSGDTSGDRSRGRIWRCCNFQIRAGERNPKRQLNYDRHLIRETVWSKAWQALISEPF
jgi:AmmeMemoRadiSam system protein B